MWMQQVPFSMLEIQFNNSMKIFYEDFSLFTHYNLKKQQPPSMDEKDDPTPKPDDLDLDQATTSGTLWFHGWHR